MSTTFIRGENPLRADKLNAALGERINRAGDAMLGPLELPSDPVAAMQAATKQYVDSHPGVPGPPGPQGLPGSIAGGTVTDPFVFKATGATTFRSIQDRAAEPYSVKDFGAAMNGTTSDSAAFQAATNATLTDGTIIVPRGGYLVPTLPTRASGNVLWKLDGNTLGTGSTPVVYAGGLDDVSESFVQGRKQFSKRATNTAPFAVLNVALDFQNAAAPNIVSSGLHLSTNAAVNTGDCFVWALNSEMTSNTNGINQHCAGAFTMRKLGTAPAFGFFVQAFDNTGSSSATSHNTVAAEIDLFVNGLDDIVGGGRQLLGLVYGRSPTGYSSAPMSVDRAFVIGPKSADLTTAYLNIMVDLGGRFEQAALNTRLGIQGTSANAIWLATDHRIAMKTDGTSYLQYTATGTPRLRYRAGGIDALAISDNGGLSSPSLPTDVRYYGAVLNGTTVDTVALRAALIATPARGTISVPPGGWNSTNFTEAHADRPILWKMTGNCFTTGTTPVSGLGNGLVESFFPNTTKYFGRTSSRSTFAGTDQVPGLGPAVRVDMVLDHTGGTTGGIEALQVNASTSATSAPDAYPFALTATLTMRSPQASGPPGTCFSAVTQRMAGAGPALAFAMNPQVTDFTALPSGTGGSLVCAEFNLKANKLDDGTLADGRTQNGAVAIPGANRSMLDLKYLRTDRNDNTPMECGSGLNIGLSTELDLPYCSLKSGILVRHNVTWAGLNFHHAIFQGNANAILMPGEARVAWSPDSPNSGTVPTNFRYLQYTSTGTARLRYMVGATEQWSVSDAGAFGTTGTASFGTGSAAYPTATGGAQATLGVGGAAADLIMNLRSKGVGAVQLGGSAFSAVQIFPAATNGGILTIGQPTTASNLIALGTSNGTTGGINFTAPVVLTRNWVYAGDRTGSILNRPFTLSQGISGVSSSQTGYGINLINTDYNNFQTPSGARALDILTRIGANCTVGPLVGLRVGTGQTASPATLAQLQWLPSHSYPSLGMIVANDSGLNLYQLTVAGTSASSGGPTGTGSNIVDGTCRWSWMSNTTDNYRNIAVDILASSSQTIDATSVDDAMGNQWGMVLGTYLGPNCQHYSQSVGLEIDDNVQGSVNRCAAFQILKAGNQGDVYDYAEWINGGYAGYRNTTMHTNSTAPDGVLFSVSDQNNAQNQTMAGVFDCLMVTPTGANTQPGWFVTGGGGYILRGPNAQLRGNGDLQLGNAGFVIGANSLTIDTTYQLLSAVGALSGGTNWSAGDLAVDAYGNVANVTAVTAGAPTAISIVGRQKTYVATASLPGGAVSWYPMHTSGVVSVRGGRVRHTAFSSASETYTPGTTLNFGTGEATIINIGRTAATTSIAGKLKTAVLLTNAATDAAAAGAGVGIGELYRNGSIVMQRAA